MLAKLKRLFRSPAATSSSRRARVCRPRLEVLEERRLLSANLFGVGGDGRVYEQNLDASGHAYNDWAPTSDTGRIISNVSTSTDVSGNVHLFGVGGNGNVYEQNLDSHGNALSAWYPTSPSAQITSSVSVSTDGRHLFGVGGNGRVYEQDLNANGQAVTSWSPTSSSGTIVSNVTVSGSHLFGLGTGGGVYKQNLDANGHGVGGWSPIDSGGFLVSDVSVSADGRHVFAVGGDGRVYEHLLDASANGVGSWYATSSSGVIDSRVAVGTDVYGSIHLFGVGGNGNVYEQDLDVNGNAASGWYSTDTTAGVTSNVNLSSDDSGHMHLFGVGRDGRVYEQDLDASDHAVTSWFATSSTGQIYSDVSQSGGWFASNGVSVLGSLNTEPAAGRLYSPASGTLFGPGGPSYLDVQQGVVGDCWLLASLAEVAARAPQDITSMFSYAGTGWADGSPVSFYNVRFYDGSGVAHTVTVDTELPQGGSFYDHPVGGSGAVNGSTTPVLWVALAEKAYAEANMYGYVTTNNSGFGSYGAVNYGDAAWALQAITGAPAGDYSINPDDVAAAWNAGQMVVLCTSSPASSAIVGNHCYALVNYDPSSGLPFEVFNPWGTDANGWAPGNANSVYGLFVANGAFLSQNFSTESFGGGAAPAGDMAPMPANPTVAQSPPQAALYSKLGIDAAMAGNTIAAQQAIPAAAERTATHTVGAADQAVTDLASQLAMRKRMSALDAIFADAGSW
jgi:hypothetical protein